MLCIYCHVLILTQSIQSNANIPSSCIHISISTCLPQHCSVTHCTARTVLDRVRTRARWVALLWCYCFYSCRPNVFIAVLTCIYVLALCRKYSGGPSCCSIWLWRLAFWSYMHDVCVYMRACVCVCVCVCVSMCVCVSTFCHLLIVSEHSSYCISSI